MAAPAGGRHDHFEGSLAWMLKAGWNVTGFALDAVKRCQVAGGLNPAWGEVAGAVTRQTIGITRG